jgi:hypothetical protein
MARDYEPFLINPPRRRPKIKLKRKRLKFKKNDFYPGMEEALASEEGIGILPGHKKVTMSKAHRKNRKRAKKAWNTRRKHAKGVKVERRSKMAKATRRKKKPGLRKGSAAAKAWGRKMARLRRAKTQRKVTKRKATRKRVSHKRGRKKGTRMVYSAGGYFTKGPRKTKRKVAKKRKTTASKFKKRGFAKHHKRHVVAAYKMKGHLYTSPFARTVRPMVRLNPFRNRRVHHNPFGEELAIIGANPRRRKRKSYKHNPRRRRGGYKMARRRSYSRNPMSALTSLLPTLAWATGGAFAVRVVPRLVNKFVPSIAGPWTNYGVQAATAVGGYYLIDKYKGKGAADSFITGAIASVLGSVVDDLTSGFLQGLGLDALPGSSDYGYLPGNEYVSLGEDVQSIMPDSFDIQNNYSIQ